MKKTIQSICALALFLVVITSCGNSKSTETVATMYACPMHPEQKSDKPGTCPVCNMDMEKVEAKTGSTTTNK